MQGWAFPGVAFQQQQQQQQQQHQHQQQPHEQQQQQQPHQQGQSIVRKPSSGDQLVQVSVTHWHAAKHSQVYSLCFAKHEHIPIHNAKQPWWLGDLQRYCTA